MNREHLRYCNLVLVVICVFFCEACRPGKVHERDPWLRQTDHLLGVWELIKQFKEENGEWPRHVSELPHYERDGVSYDHFRVFVDPSSQLSYDWLLFPPDERIRNAQAGPFIIAAAPRCGGRSDSFSRKRLVLYDSGKICWIMDNEFHNAIASRR